MQQKETLELHKKVYEIKDFCNIVMLSEDTKILEFNQYQNYDKAPIFIPGELKCIIGRLMDVKKILKIHLQQK